MRNVTTWAYGIGLRLRNLLTKRISWTSGEADNPGPTHFVPQHVQSQDNEKTHNRIDHRDAHVNDVRFRFHNVQGLRDSRFRSYYLRRARTTCEILALAETNCLSESEGKWWSRDWLGNAGCFWTPAPSPPQGQHANTCRGMAILFSSTLGDIKASELWRDPEGRGLAVKACIHGHDTVIIAFHADCSSEEAQATSYHKLRQHVPMLPHHHYIWMLDANNVVNLRLDAKTSSNEPVRRNNVSGINAMNHCSAAWGGLRDAYRWLNPTGREYTRRQVDRKDPANRANDKVSWRRLDRILISPSLLKSGATPEAMHVRHIHPKDTDILAVRRAGSLSKWSDHSAVQLTMRFTNTKQAPARWSVPRHLLGDASLVNGEIRKLASSQNKERYTAKEDLTRILGRTRCFMRRKVWQEAKRRGQRMQLLRKWLAETERAIGDDKGQVGSMADIPNDEPTKAARVAHFLRRKEEIEEEMLEIVEEKQRHWLKDRSFDEFTTGETCSRAFFEEARNARVYSHIDHVKNKNGQKITGTGHIMRQAREHFGARGSIFNLNPEGTNNRDESDARARLLDAIQRDGKILTNEQSARLSIETVFSPENVQVAIDELQTNTTPGLDGWTAEYFRTAGQRVKDENDILGPSPLTHLISMAFIECAHAPGGGKLMPCMCTSVVSLIYKEKGLRNDLSKYRPIAVSSILYRIMAKAMVIAIRPILPSVTSDCQKAFKPNEVISDSTRLVQDTIQSLKQKKKRLQRR